MRTRENGEGPKVATREKRLAVVGRSQRAISARLYEVCCRATTTAPRPTSGLLRMQVATPKNCGSLLTFGIKKTERVRRMARVAYPTI